jgi:hypothetical protein
MFDLDAKPEHESIGKHVSRINVLYMAIMLCHYSWFLSLNWEEISFSLYEQLSNNGNLLKNKEVALILQLQAEGHISEYSPVSVFSCKFPLSTEIICIWKVKTVVTWPIRLLPQDFSLVLSSDISWQLFKDPQ